PTSEDLIPIRLDIEIDENRFKDSLLNQILNGDVCKEDSEGPEAPSSIHYTDFSVYTIGCCEGS
ncbi:hypothetical protein MKW98_029157, partial [Papaver atlanticum]